MKRFGTIFGCAALVVGICFGEVGVEVVKEGEAVELRVSGDVGDVLTVEGSSGFGRWVPVFAGRGTEEVFEDPDFGLWSERFYRARANAVPVVRAHPSWKNRVMLPGDDLLSGILEGVDPTQFSFQEIRWVKFAVLRDDLATVYFQDSESYPFHYDFGAERLPGLTGLSREEFDRATLYDEGNVALLGAVLVNVTAGEFGVEIVGADAVPRELVAWLLGVLEGSLDTAEGMKGFYFPTAEQAVAAEAEREYFAGRGIEVSSVRRWISGNQCYADGWAMGRLRWVPGGEIEAAYRSGVLLPTDILLTDRVPAEVPFVAGIIALEPATPNSHVAILAASYGVPFVYVSGEVEADRLVGLVGGEVVLQSGGWQCEVEVVEVPGDFPDELRDDLLSRKVTPVLEVPVKEEAGFYVAEVDGARPRDIAKFGGKAANFGILRRVLARNSPSPARVLPFDVWNDYLGQAVVGEGTLAEAIGARLGGEVWPPEELDGLLDRLAEVRELVRGGGFSPGQEAAILGGLGDAGFAPDAKIRFRSSTNVEDGASFIGAGLYDSYSGCLADDLDGDDEGPSHCDPTKLEERGVLRAVRKVFASFYNDNAFLERLRRGVDEADVGMAVLVHPSFPDPIEEANGVATIEFDFRQSWSSVFGEVVTQLGAVSVTNPEGGAVPEVVTMSVGTSGGAVNVYPRVVQRSSLLLLGQDHVMEWEGDYDALGEMLWEVGQAWRAEVRKDLFTLDFEFKKLAPAGRLVVKQVREVPVVVEEEGEAVLMGAPERLQVFQGEAADVWANHRLKLQWDLVADSRRLEGEGSATSWFTSGSWEHVLDGMLGTTAGAPGDFPGAVHEVVTNPRDAVWDRWDGTSLLGGATRFGLEVDTTVYSPAGPVRTIDDFRMHLHADYARDVLPNGEWNGDADVDVVRLEKWRDPSLPLPAGSTLKERTGSGVSIKFWWPPAPTGPTAGYTAPLQRWEETVLTGFTSAPIVLRGYYSQTYRPGHHNFSEEFVFEPRLEEGIDPAVVAELEAADVRMVYVQFGFVEAVVQVVGRDGRVRAWRK